MGTFQLLFLPTQSLGNQILMNEMNVSKVDARLQNPFNTNMQNDVC